ncbi:hypothetical protein BHE74_00047497 [Ensete ventricosum]|nr:hypothetical protein BHE74_00047497 [Ensete ventricosum]RZS21284.1 hypothetical protein BHM03_00053913 [Ensete ventricosum]
MIRSAPTTLREGIFQISIAAMRWDPPIPKSRPSIDAGPTSSSHGVRLSSPSSSRRWASLRRRPRVRSSALLYGGGRPVDTQTLIVTASVLAAVALSLFLGLKVTPLPYALFTSEKNPDFEAGCRVLTRNA